MSLAIKADPANFELPPSLTESLRGKRVLITGAGKDGGLGQAFALAAGLNGAESVGIHFHNSYSDGLETVALIEARGGRAFPIQADVTNPRDVWSIRSHVIEKMGGKPPNLLICNSGLSESGYLLGRAPKHLDDEPMAWRRARVRQAFVDNLRQSHDVVDTKVDGFLAMTHLWASEALEAKEPLTVVYISSRQAVDPGPGVPGYVVANWAVSILPKVLALNLGRNADQVTALTVGYPFVRTGMTEDYVDNERVYGRWQPRMLEPSEAAKSLMQLLSRPSDELRERFFQLEVDKAEGDGDADIACKWTEIAFGLQANPLAWSHGEPLKFGPSGE